MFVPSSPRLPREGKRGVSRASPMERRGADASLSLSAGTAPAFLDPGIHLDPPLPGAELRPPSQSRAGIHGLSSKGGVFSKTFRTGLTRPSRHAYRAASEGL